MVAFVFGYSNYTIKVEKNQLLFLLKSLVFIGFFEFYNRLYICNNREVNQSNK